MELKLLQIKICKKEIGQPFTLKPKVFLEGKVENTLPLQVQDFCFQASGAHLPAAGIMHAVLIFFIFNWIPGLLNNVC